MRLRAQSGFSLIETMIVVALIAFVYTVAIPQLSLRSGAEISTKMSMLAGDVRSAYDLSVLTGKTYRMVINFVSGDYWLEESDAENFVLGSERANRDPTEQEEKDFNEQFDAKFQEYQDLAGTVVVDQDKDKEIPPESPVLKAKDKLKRPKWARVENMEWSERSIGPHLMVRAMQAEHHGVKQDASELGQEARGMIYFFPSGYVERAWIQIAYKKDDVTIDDTQEGYTVTTDPYEGEAKVEPGWQDIDVHEKKTE